MINDKFRKEVEKLVEDGHVENAIKKTIEKLNNSVHDTDQSILEKYKNEIISLSSQLNRLNSENRVGNISKDKYLTEIEELSNRFLAVLSKIPKEKNNKGRLYLLLFMIALSFLTVFYFLLNNNSNKKDNPTYPVSEKPEFTSSHNSSNAGKKENDINEKVVPSFKSVTQQIKVTNSDGLPMRDVHVRISIDQDFFSAFTDSSGIAEIIISKKFDTSLLYKIEVINYPKFKNSKIGTQNIIIFTI